MITTRQALIDAVGRAMVKQDWRRAAMVTTEPGAACFYRKPGTSDGCAIV